MNTLLSSSGGIVTLHNGKAVCSSVQVAEHFHKRHKNVIQTIEKQILPQVTKDFSRLNFQPSDYTDSRGKTQPMYYMTRDGFTLLAMGFTGKEAMTFKVQYIAAFNAMEKLLFERKTPQFLEMREESKQIRRTETDAIRDFVEYAKFNGSMGADWYYKAFTDMVNRAVGITSRAQADTETERRIQAFESIIADKIKKGIARNDYYKSIFAECRELLNVATR